MIYSVRPLNPTEQLLLCFRHSNYTPARVPLNVDFAQKFSRRTRLLRFLLRKFVYTPQVRSVLENDENDFIKQVCFETDSELKNNSIFFKG